MEEKFKRAVKLGELEKVKEMIKEYGVEHFSHVKFTYMSTLGATINFGHKHITRFLIESGWDINELDGYKSNALYYAVAENDKETFLYLIEKGIDMNHQGGLGYTVFMDALELIEIEYAEILYQNGVNLNIRDERGRDFLYCMDDFETKEMKKWIDRFLQEPQRFEEGLLQKIKTKRLELLMS